MPAILSSLACNLDANILLASLPLMEEERVQAIEWAFDALYDVKDVPPWFDELIGAYSNEHRLVGHGVFFSLFSGRWSTEQQEWLVQLKALCRRYNFDHITEHFGFMTGRDFHHGAPLNIPYSQTTLDIGRTRLARIYEACECPVGLENLAFAASLDEVKRHGEFLERLIEPINGFIILDLHNLFCQLHNFSASYEDIIQRYPLHRVREIHISGGSWEDAVAEPGHRIRRDTHDDAVPQDVFALLEKTIGRCPNLQYVVMEQLGVGLDTEQRRRQFYNDFVRMEEIVDRQNKKGMGDVCNDFLPSTPLPPEKRIEDETLYRQQLLLSDILESAGDYRDAVQKLQASPLAHTDWRIEDWSHSMIETAVNIAQKWKKKD